MGHQFLDDFIFLFDIEKLELIKNWNDDTEIRMFQSIGQNKFFPKVRKYLNYVN